MTPTITSQLAALVREGFTFPAPGSGFRADKSRRPLQQPLGVAKLVLLLIILVANTLLCLLPAAPGSTLFGPLSQAQRWRLVLCAAWGAVFIARLLCQLCVFWHRRIVPYEVIAECLVLIPASLATMAYGAATRTGPLGWMEALSIPVFLLGTHLNFWPELQRHRFKRNPDNADAPHTGGLQQLCRHINYTGEVLSFVGYALASGQWWNLWVPACMAFGMVRASVPEIEHYLAERYKVQWTEYCRRVPYVMVPGVF